MGQSPIKYQYNIKQTSDENEEKLSIRGLLVDPIPNSSIIRIVHHKNCMADSNKNYLLDFSFRVLKCLTL